MHSFNLTTEAWIPCRMASDAEHKLKTLSLEETLTSAHKIAEIVGDSPPVTIAIHRLLLAVLHRSLGVLDPEAWKEGRERKMFDASKISIYLDKFRDRFDLFDEQHPFYQARDVRPPRDEEEGKDSIGQYAFEFTDTAMFFGDRTQPTLPSVSVEQAARLLIAFHSFDIGGTRSGETVKSQVNKREGTPEKAVEQNSRKEERSAKAAPLLNCAVALIRGRNLFETLMLNLFYKDDDFFTHFIKTAHELKKDEKPDLPAWERDDMTNADTRKPNGYLDLLTWQSRRLRLGAPVEKDGNLMVKQGVVIKGFRFPEKYERYDKETMLTFTRNRDPKSKREGFLPLSFDEGRVLWRDAHALFHSIKDQQAKPLMLDWLSELKDVGVLSEEDVVPIDFLGLNVDKGKPLFWRHERLPLPLRYLRDAELCNELKAALDVAEKGVAHVLTASVHRLAVLMFLPDYHMTNPDWFTPRLPKARRTSAEDKEKKDERDSKRDKDITNLRAGFAPELRYWSRLESEFRHLLIRLAKDKTGWMEARESWWRTLERVAGQAFGEIVSGAGASERTLRAAALAESWYDREMRGRRKSYFKPIEAARAHALEAGGKEGDG